MDFRFKMKFVEFSFIKIFGEEVSVFIRVVDEGIYEFFYEYLLDGYDCNFKLEDY